jgi:hypothetical protein
VQWSHAQVLACGSADGKVYLFDASATPRLPPLDPHQLRTAADVHAAALAAASSSSSGSSSFSSNGGSSSLAGEVAGAGAGAVLGWREFSACAVSDGASSASAGGQVQGAPVPVQALAARGGGGGGGPVGGAQRVYAVEWHPHEPRLASGGADGVVRLWAPVKANPTRGGAAAARGAALRR